MTKPTLKLSREAWDELGQAARADLVGRFEIVVAKFYYAER